MNSENWNGHIEVLLAHPSLAGATVKIEPILQILAKAALPKSGELFSRLDETPIDVNRTTQRGEYYTLNLARIMNADALLNYKITTTDKLMAMITPQSYHATCIEIVKDRTVRNILANGTSQYIVLGQILHCDFADEDKTVFAKRPLILQTGKHFLADEIKLWEKNNIRHEIGGAFSSKRIDAHTYARLNTNPPTYVRA